MNLARSRIKKRDNDDVDVKSFAIVERKYQSFKTESTFLFGIEEGRRLPLLQAI